MIKSEEYNLKEEIEDGIKKALKDGIDNELCGVFRVMRKEQFSPKGKAIILDKGYYEKILYSCNLCRACGDELCDKFQKARQVLVHQKKEFQENKEMAENLQKTGNVFGIRKY